MNELFSIFINNLLPVLLAAGAGYLLARLLRVNPRPLSQVIFYIFSPCLIFTLLTQSKLSNGDIVMVMGFAAATILVIGVLTWLAGKVFRLGRRALVGVLLASMLMNAGNYGLPVVLFAFGEAALSYASLFFVTNAIMAYTVGVVIASMGSTNLIKAFINLLKLPTLYALILAFIFMFTGWQVPQTLERTTSLLGNASIPAMLVLLGLQLQAANWSANKLPLTIVSVMRLVISPIIALLLAPIFGITGVSRQAVSIEAGMPSAVLSTVLATEYDVEPALVTSAVFITTVLSPLTLTPLLAFLGA